MKKAKLYLKGVRTPLELTEEQGLKAKLVKEDPTILNSTNVTLADGLWTGEKGDIRYIMFETVVDYKDSNNFTSYELKEFEKELESYLLTKEDAEFKDLVDGLVKDIVDNRQLFYSTEMLAEILAIRELHLKEADIFKRAEKLILKGYVGTLTKKGELKFLEDRLLIKIHDDGKDFSVIKNSDNSIPYNAMNQKLSEYHSYKGRITYAKQMDVKHLEEMAERVGVDETQEF